MARYHVDHRYSSGTFGPWIEGDHVELSPEEATWVNRDSEGTLSLVDPAEQARVKREAQEEGSRRQQAERDAKAAREAAAQTTETPAPKRRGRPPGSGVRKAT